MQLNISGHHVDVTESMNDYIKEKFVRLERHADHINSIQVILSVEKLVQKAEATLRITGSELFATAESEDMYAAIDNLVDKLDRQVLKHKERLISRKQSAR
jgi:putative sigma-54 modulation protein